MPTASRPARSVDARRSDATLRRAARALEAERAPLPRAMPAETRKAFEGLSDAAPAPASKARPTPSMIAITVSEQLTAKGAPGMFATTAHNVTMQLEWTGAACHRGEAERALVEALQAVGYQAGALPSFGVRVMVPVRPAVTGEVIPVVREHTCLTTGNQAACGRCQQLIETLPAWAAPLAAAVCESAGRRTPDRIETLCGLEEPLGDEPYDEEPPAVHANARKLTALGPVTPSDMDPGERNRSLMGRICKPFGEV